MRAVDEKLIINELGPYINGKGHLRESTHLRYTRHKGRVVMLSPAQWCSSVQLFFSSGPHTKQKKDGPKTTT